jgi:hypothetical protein
LFPILLLIKATCPFFSNFRKGKEKRLKNKDAVFFSTLKVSGTDIQKKNGDAAIIRRRIGNRNIDNPDLWRD